MTFEGPEHRALYGPIKLLCLHFVVDMIMVTLPETSEFIFSINFEKEIRLILTKLFIENRNCVILFSFAIQNNTESFTNFLLEGGPYKYCALDPCNMCQCHNQALNGMRKFSLQALNFSQHRSQKRLEIPIWKATEIFAVIL